MGLGSIGTVSTLIEDVNLHIGCQGIYMRDCMWLCSPRRFKTAGLVDIGM